MVIYIGANRRRLYHARGGRVNTHKGIYTTRVASHIILAYFKEELEMEIVQSGMIIEYYVERGEISLVVADNSIDLSRETLQQMLDMLENSDIL
jgi:hypothetical protein